MKEESENGRYEAHQKHNYSPCIELNSSFLSRMFFVWTNELIRRGNQKALEMDDLSDLRPDEEALENHDNFSKVFYAQPKKAAKRLLQSFKGYIGFTFLMAGILATIANLLQFSGPLMINKILEFLASGNQGVSEGATYVTILIGCYLLRTIIFQHSMHYVNLSCTKVLNSSTSLLYHKILALSSASRKYLDAGSIMTHLNVDIMSFYYFIMMGTFVFSAPIMIVAAIVLLGIEVGLIGLAAPGIFLLGMIAQNYITKKGFALRKDQLFWTDKRTKCVTEYFGGIRILKYYGWEQLAADKIEAIRTEEIKINFRGLMLRGFIDVIMNMLPIFASIIIFAVYAAVNGEDSITPAKVYTVLSVFNLIAIPMRLLIMTAINFINSRASLDRVDHFFNYEEKKAKGINEDDLSLEKGTILFENCGFNWDNKKVAKHALIAKQLSSKAGFKPPASAQAAPVKAPTKEPTHDELKESLISLDSAPKKMRKKRKVRAFAVNRLHIPKGQFVTVIGRVGSGKSTFLYSILGEIDKVEGRISRRGTVAYIPQVSWLRSKTIRENILFGCPYDEAKYLNVLRICELEQDLAILPGRDMAEIGEKGVNLSGGQKQRVSIARAVYADADIYLIDDCLSALDPYVGKNIFFNVLKSHLQDRGKTIVFVTNAVHFTDYTNRVIVLEKGRITDDGTPEELKHKHSRTYDDVVLTIEKKKSADEREKEEAQRKEEDLKHKKEQDLELEAVKLEEEEQTEDSKKPSADLGALVKVEERLKGSVPWKFYYRFFTGPGKIRSILMFLFITLAQMARVFSDWWLGEWGSNSLNLPGRTYIGIYAGISVLVGVLIYLKSFFFARFIVATSRVIQRSLIASLLKAPLSWFDVTPTGRIIARTTKDQDDLDSNLAFNVQFSAQNLLVLFSSILIISIATPLYLIVAAISGLVYYRLIGLYMNSSRELKRLEANTRAPLLTHISETINGTYVIRAFGRKQQFIDEFFVRQKALIVCIVNQNITSRWINIVTDMFSTLTIAATGYFGVVSAATGLGSQSASFIGLALVWSLQISSIMSFTLRLLADTESCMNSAVRLYDYIDNNPSERSFDSPQPSSNDWPSEGRIEVNRVSFKYRPELPRVLKQISFSIKAYEKIGVVGRTGSGKSTLTLGMLRILELAENEDKSTGFITMDQENTSEIGLHCLRHKITIIPQDPTLFTGTIKTNLDPFNEYTDEEIRESLKKVSLWDQLKENPEEVGELRRKVYGEITDSGNNFSLGQKQLICMARALIRKPRVLLMDEATASIDEKTDETIQKMIRNEFLETTVITIAHRLNTIIYYDKILVLEKGEVKEYDEPLVLVKNSQSFLGKIIRKMGDEYMRKIINLAEEAKIK